MSRPAREIFGSALGFPPAFSSRAPLVPLRSDGASTGPEPGGTSATGGSSQTKGLLVNGDGSVDVYFGPTPPVGKEKNCVQNVPGKGWNVILRLYSPLEPWFAKTWRPGEIELVE